MNLVEKSYNYVAIALLIIGYKWECTFLYNISAGIFLGMAWACWGERNR